jgi:ATP adenylyltransferase
VATSFEHLREFIHNQMRMSHIYQPVMIKELLAHNGKASIRDIAAAFLARDESQLEYYEQITKSMPGKVLSKHGIVERDGESYCLTTDLRSLSQGQRKQLVQLCNDAISAYLQKRGAAVYDHRRAALGYISGSLRYEVLKRAGHRCELCGIPAVERAIEVDHIVLRKHGGEGDLTNLQALCFRCNANKGARDDQDFRVVREGIGARQPGCIFCELPAGRIIASNALAVSIRDQHRRRCTRF